MLFRSIAQRRREEGDIFGSLIFRALSKGKGEERKAEEFVKVQREKEKAARKAAAEEEFAAQEKALTSLIERLGVKIPAAAKPATLVAETTTPTKLSEQQTIQQQKLTDAIREAAPKEETQQDGLVKASVEDFSRQSLVKLKSTLVDAFKTADIGTGSGFGGSSNFTFHNGNSHVGIGTSQANYILDVQAKIGRAHV